MAKSRILFVEDNPTLSLLNCTVLREVGYEVTEATSAREAARIIADPEPIAALVTDINLGPGEDGFQVARRARAAYPDLPVVFISAAAGARFPDEGVEGSQFVAKPFPPRLILEALDRALRAAAT